jgi:LPXTG-motif cell wall-anchored protein
MRKTGIILFYLFFTILVKAQKPFTSIVPQSAVVAGEAFQVQYVVEDGAKASNFNAPVFQGFRVVSGPNVYSGTTTNGNTLRQSKNFVITLVALKPGKFIIPGAVIKIDGKQVKSNNSFIEVLSKEMALKRFDKETMGNSDYFLRPGENVQDKIRKNLFLKVLVDKRSCFIGEPVLATFKLYSRLESKSDIIKNPGFYGFTVYDAVNLADNQVATEKVNGKLFDVHIIRKVQLYPLQTGVFTIDAMEVKNKVEFSRSAVNKKTEQEIVEGVLGNNEWDEKKENAEEFESSMSTEPVTINVKQLPDKSKPILFDGATGFFTITAEAVKNKLSLNEGDILEITIRGKGNFVQMNAPVVQWPEGIEGFDPSLKDLLDKSVSPLAGSRTYRYPFVSATGGEYTIPGISLSFFNPDSGSYKTITTNVLPVKIDNTRPDLANTNQVLAKTATNSSNLWFVGGGVLLVLGCLIWFLKKRKINFRKETIQQTERKNNTLSVEQVLAPAFLLVKSDDKSFYSSLRKAVSNYFGFHFNLSGSEISKEKFFKKLKENKVNEELITELQDMLQQCEAGLFTNADLSVDKNLLLNKARKILEKINESLF